MANESHFKTVARCAPGTWATGFKKAMKKAGYTVESDRETIVAKMDDTVVARGLKMGAMGWMVRADPKVVEAAPNATNSPHCEASYR